MPKTIVSTPLTYHVKDKVFTLHIYYRETTKRYTYKIYTDKWITKGAFADRQFVDSGHASWTNSVMCAKNALSKIAIIVGCKIEQITCVG